METSEMSLGSFINSKTHEIMREEDKPEKVENKQNVYIYILDKQKLLHKI
jgi:hypothetical protein